MKKRLLITAVACVLSMGLVACGGNNGGGGGGNTPDPGPVEPEYEVKISNKEALKEPWKVGDAQRSVGIAPIKGVTIAEAIEQGLIKITSDHPEYVSVDGRLLSPVGAGTATITVSYKEKSDSVAIEVSQASLFKMIAEPKEGVNYYVGHKDSSGSGKMVFMKNAVSSNYYLGWEKEQDNALYAQVKIDTSATDDYKYQISFTTKDEEGVETTKFVGVANTSKGKFAVGIANEEVVSVEPHFTPQLANFKLDDEHRLVVKILDGFDNNKEYELVLGASAGYDTFGLGAPEKIMWPARLYVLSDEAIPATSMTVTPEELKLAPGTVGKISYELEPVETTDSVSFETSDKEVATVDVAGNVTAVAEGTATITVKANENVSKTVSVTVEGETVNYGSKEAPLSVADAKTALDALGAGNLSPVPMYVEGEVFSAKWDSGYSNSEIWLKDAEGNKAFELYRAVGDADPEQEGKLMDISGLLPGDKVKAYGYAKIHNGTYELTTNSGGNPASPTVYYMEIVEHTTTPEPELVTGKTIAEFLADTSGEYKQLYELTGEVTKFKSSAADKYGNVYIKDEAGTELYVYGSTATASALVWDELGGTYVFTNPQDFLTNELTKDIKVGDKLTIKATLTSYNGNPQANAIITKVEEGEGGGGGEEIPEPALVTGKTIAEFKADASGEFKQLYELTGTVTKWNKGTDAGKYGNFYIEDESGELLIYGSTATEGKLAWDATQGKYVLNNPQDFLTNEVTKDMKIGDTVTVHATLTSYNGNPQAQAQVMSVTPGTPEDIPEPALVTGKTIADFKADASGEFKQLYELTGTVTKWNKGSNAGDYGNFYIEDESGELLIYGSTATEGKLAWDATQGKYVLSNPKDFLTNEVTKDMKIGDTVTVHATLTSYQGNPQAQAQVMSVTPGEVPELTGIKFDVEGESIELIEGRTKAIKLLPLPELAELPEEDPTWESSDPEVATIAEGNNVGGIITAVKEGTAKITAKYSDEIKAELTVNVVKDSGEQGQEVTVELTPSNFSGTETKLEYSANGLKVVVSKGTAADQIRIFKGETITFTAGTIKSVTFECTANGTAKYGPGCFAALEGYEFDASGKTGTWSGEAESVAFTAESNQVRAVKITVVYVA